MHQRDDDFDQRLLQHHRQAVSQVSARTRAQLQQRLHASVSPSRRVRRSKVPAWSLAAACAVLVVVVGVRWFEPGDVLPNQPPAVATTPSAATGMPSPASGAVLASLDEPPDLYLWLASDDARAMLAE